MANPTLAYTAPFASFVLLMSLGGWLGISPALAYPIRVAVGTAVWLACSRGLIGARPSRPAADLLLGAGVFLVWIAPDLLWPGYRAHWLFRNALTTAAAGPLDPAERAGSWFLISRVAGSALLVPVIEELFWRGWLMRRLIAADFQRVPPGTYSVRAFWITAVLFASEHGPYWDVGLAAGLAYNWWMLRTRNLADCVTAHAATNACLAGWVLVRGEWSYWL